MPENSESLINDLENLRTQAEEHLKAISDTKNQIVQTLTDIQSAKQQSQQNAATAKQHETSAQQNLENSKRLFADVEKYRDDSLAKLELIKKEGQQVTQILSSAEKQEKSVQEYEKKLDGLIKNCDEIKQQINSLLPGATSTNLAYAFQNSKNDVARHRYKWAFLQIIAITGFIGMGFWILTHGHADTWQQAFIFVINKSPILLGLVALEEIGRRNYNVCERLEEDYRYKEVLSSSYIGYRDQMEKQKDTESINQLSKNLLSQLGQEPGRMIDKVRPPRRIPTDLLDQLTDKIGDDSNKKT